ncbi:ArdC family protein [Rhizobium sp. Nf11,1]|uniref:ArdC family protein n=1 Tax=Rhizobium sp. Nf11,1 TaxID=3404923 RepID=UPI003D349107
MKTADLYASVTAEVIRQIEEGTPPWVRPWKDAKLKGVGMIPTNLVSGRMYSGGNILLLWLAASQRGFRNLQYATYHQINAIGAKVRKGEKATHVIFTKHGTKKDEESGEDKPTTIVKTYPVFGLDQLDDVPAKYLQQQERPESQVEIYTKASDFVKGTGIKIKNGGNRAAYYPGGDEIVMPFANQFESEEAYWQTLFHESTHWTGHKNRLDRQFGKRFGDKAYSFEELVAELGSAFLSARMDIPAGFRSAAYIESWLKVLKEDNRAIFTAASYAGQSTDYLWRRAFPDPEEQQREAAA